MPSQRTAVLACLLWKEWREIRWKLAALLAIVLALFAWSVTDSDRNGSDSYSVAFSFSFLLVLPLGSAFIAMNLAAGEASRGTLPMFRSQPVRQEWVAAIKLVLGIVTVWLTQVVTVLCVLGLVDQGGMSSRVAREIYSNFPALVETGHWSGDLLVTSALLIASFVLWIAAPGVNSESEVRSGAIGLGLIAFVWSGVVAFYYFTDIFDSPIVQAAHAALPGGVVLAPLGRDPEQAITTFALAAYLSTHAPLAWWYVTRYGKTERVSGQ